MQHHHHFRCSSCNRVFDWFGCTCPCEANAPKGFEVRGHEIYLFGLCDACVAKGAVAVS